MLSATPLSGAVSAASSVVSDLSTVLSPVGGAAIAIVGVTIAVRLALHPLNRVAVRGERARVRLAPQVAAIRQKHAKNITRMGEELRTLYRNERISPYAGLLPLIVQAPIFLLLYHVFATASGSLATAGLFGVPLSTRFIGAAGGLGVHVLVFIALFAALAAIAAVTSRRAKMLAKINTVAGTAVAAGTAVGAAEVVAKVSQLAPFFVLISGAVLPLAVGIYLVTTTAWSAAENALLRRGLAAKT